MATFIYARGLQEIATGALELGRLEVLLVQPSYRPSRLHEFVEGDLASPARHELAVDGYVRQTLDNVRVTQSPLGFTYLDADDLDFGDLGLGERIGGAVLCRAAGRDTEAPLIAFFDLGRQPTTSGPVTLEWAAPEDGGVVKLTEAGTLL